MKTKELNENQEIKKSFRRSERKKKPTKKIIDENSDIEIISESVKQVINLYNLK